MRHLRQSLAFLSDCRDAQSELGAGPTVNSKSIPRGDRLLASTGLMDRGFGFPYGPSLHIGATGWYLLAALGGNPLQLGYSSLHSALLRRDFPAFFDEPSSFGGRLLGGGEILLG